MIRTRLTTGLAIVTFLAVGTLEAGCGNRRAPDDASLIEVFHSHRAAFDEVRQLAPHGAGSSRLAKAGGLLDAAGASNDPRLRQLQEEIGRHTTVYSADDGMVKFTMARGGVLAVGPGWSKGIEFFPGDPKRAGSELADLDKAPSMPADIYVRRLGDGWFLFYQKAE
jgi:hypothetical protein